MSHPENLEDYLRQKGERATGTYKCPMPLCRHKGAASTFAYVAHRADHFDGHGFVCSSCLFRKDAALAAERFDAEMRRIAAMTDEEKAEVSSLVDWWSAENEEANHLRAERRIIFSKWGWTQLPGQGDMLTEACRTAFKNYFSELNDFAIKYAKPSDVRWPVLPALEYA